MILALKGKDATYMASSLTEVIVNTSLEDTALDDNMPLWKVENRENTYIGFSVPTRLADRLRYVDLFEGVDEIDYNSLVSIVAPRLNELATEFCEKSDSGKWLTNCVIVCGEHIYKIDRSFCVEESVDFALGGYSIEILEGAFEYNNMHNVPARESIADAIHTFDLMRTNLTFPLLVYNTSTGEREHWLTYEDAMNKIHGE